MSFGRYVIPALTCVMVLAYCLNRHMGFMLIFVVPIVVVWSLAKVYSAWTKPEYRKTEALRVGMWALTLSAVILTHLHYASSSRETADRVASALIAYKLTNGVYPESIDIAAPELVRPAKNWRMYYSAKDQKPFLMYPATWVIYEKWIFNFQNHQWEYRAD